MFKIGNHVSQKRLFSILSPNVFLPPYVQETELEFIAIILMCLLRDHLCGQCVTDPPPLILFQGMTTCWHRKDTLGGAHMYLFCD